MVVIQCDVTAQGVIRDCVTLKDEAGLAEDAIQRMVSMRGIPATHNGKPIDIR